MLLTWDRWLFLGASYYGLRLATRALPICLCGTMFATVSLVGTSRSMTSRVSPWLG